MADKNEPQLDDKTIKSLMPAIDITKLRLKGDKVLIYHEDQNRETKTAGGVIMTDKTLEKARLDKLTLGTIVTVGNNMIDPDVAVGRQALFYRQHSEGGIKGTDDKVYVLFSEYNIYGTLPAATPTSPLIGIA